MTSKSGLRSTFAPVVMQLRATQPKPEKKTESKSTFFGKIFKGKADTKTPEQKPWSYLALGKQQKKELTKILEDQPEDSPKPFRKAPYIESLQKQLFSGPQQPKKTIPSYGTLREQRAAKMQTMKQEAPILDDKQLWDFLIKLKGLKEVTPEEVALLSEECDGFILRLITVIQITKEDTEERRNFALTLVRMCAGMIEINKAVKNQQRIDSYATIIEDTAIEEALLLRDFLPEGSQL